MLCLDSGPDMIEVSINKDLQEIFGVISRTNFFGLFDDEFKIFRVDTLHKKINDTHLVILVNDLVEGLGKKEALFSVFPWMNLHT